MAPESYRRIKGYELREWVGAGGSGAVYRAYQTSIGREVAIKVILPQYANQPEFIRRFEVEAQLIARLEHPYIVPLFDYWRDPDGAYLVMRWLPSNLRLSLERGAWSAEMAARMLEQLAGALTIAHREGVIHRDIKPENILLDEDKNAYLADFGIAKDTHVKTDKETGTTVGSPAYITPEQIKGEPVTAQTDIYSLGLVIYESLAGERPYADATTPEELNQRHLNTPLPYLATRHLNLPAALDEVLQTATAKNPEQRYTNVLRFAAQFRAALPNLVRTVAQPLADPLTARELDILGLMVEGMSNREIAARLVVTPGTVKWYVGQIYSKLDVHSRHQAIERARQLHLVAFLGEPGLAPTVPDATRDEVKHEGDHSSFRHRIELVNPYKGLRAFREADAADFFGRATLTERLLARLSSTGDGARFLTVIGPSGSGKSSLVKAALIPALRQGALPNSAHWFITEMLPGTHPLEELEAALLRVSVNPLPGILDQLTEDRRGLVRAAKRILPADQEVELVLVIDQFEELFTLTADEKVRMHFIDNLLSAVSDPRGRVRLLLTLRADFYDRPLLYPRLAELARSHSEVIVPMDASELERAIAGPAERVGLKLESSLVATLVNDVGEQPGALPLLQYALSELYERRVENRLTLAAYREIGGLSGALARRADGLFEALDATGQAAARQLFLRLITLGEGVEDTRRRVLQAELSSLLDENRVLEDVIDAYTQYRLLTFDRDPLTRGPTVEIAHEALIREWGRLREWLLISREALRVQRRLMTFSDEWLANSKEPSYLASGARLMQFEALAQDGDLRLNQAERAYLEASISAREQQEHRERERQARELQLAQQSANRLRSLVAALAIFLVIAAGLSLFAFNSRTDALSNFTRAEAQRLAAVSNNLRLQHQSSEVAALLAVRSMRLQYTVQGDEALANAATLDLPIRTYTGNTNTSAMVVYSPDGQYLANASWDGTARLWDTQTGQEIREFEIGQPFASVAFSPDGRYLATGGPQASLWNVETGEKIRQFFVPSNGVSAVVFSPDGRYLLTSADNTALLWNVQTGQELQRYVGHTQGLAWGDLAFFPDGQHVMTGSSDQTVRVWDTFSGQETRQINVDVQVFTLALSPDSQSVLLGGSGGMLQLWDLQTGTLIRNFVGNSIQANAVGFLPGGQTIYSAAQDYTIRLWDVATGQEQRRLVGHNQALFYGALSPDGQYLVSSSYDKTMRLWNIGQSGGLPQFISSGNAINFSVAVSPDGNSVLTGGVDHIARLWNAHTGQLIRQLVGHSDNVFWVAFSPDGQDALTGGESDNTARLWDVNSGQEVRQFRQNVGVARTVFSPDGKLILTTPLSAVPGHLWNVQTGEEVQQFNQVTRTMGFNDVAFSPDSRFVVTSSYDESARLWDTHTGQQIHVWNVVGGTYSAAYAPDGKSIFVGDNQGITHQWDVQSGQEVKQFVGHTDAVNNLAVSPDGRYLLSGGDTTARLWNIATGQEIRRFVGHTTQVSSVAFFPDGKHVLTGSVDGVAHEWDVDYHNTIRNLCARLLRDFTDAERIQYGITDHDPTCPPESQSVPPVIPLTWTPIPTATIPVWTPLPLTPLLTDAPVLTATAQP